MIKVITYGTYDLLHYGHIKLLERAKALGDYLIVGVTSDDFDKQRGKINVQQSLEERVAAVKKTGLADKIIIEEYEGQKIDDIKKYGIDIFTVGSDWTGYFDYLKEYCKVVYLPRTQGVSSTEIRSEKSSLRMGMVGYSSFLKKFFEESKYVNAVKIVGLCSNDISKLLNLKSQLNFVTNDYNQLLDNVDAVYIHSNPSEHYQQVKKALEHHKHVLCESPIALKVNEVDELLELSKKNECVLVEAIRTAYMTAYQRLLLLLKSGKIGRVVSVDATCTSLRTYGNFSNKSLKWGAMTAWGPTALLPVFQILGTNITSCGLFSIQDNEYKNTDAFSKVNLEFGQSTATVKVGTGVKSEGELIVSGTKGYAYVPAPWWKTDYFELRFEDSSLNKRYFYQVDGEGIRYELVALAESTRDGKSDFYINRYVTKAIARVMEEFDKKYVW